jgi:hypothetical protein
MNQLYHHHKSSGPDKSANQIIPLRNLKRQEEEAKNGYQLDITGAQTKANTN